MKNWKTRTSYVIGLTVLLALAVAQTIAIVVPCGFKWG
jgi:hypothetical protein